MRSLLCLCFSWSLLAVACVNHAFSAGWHHPLALDGGNYWRQRMAVAVENGGSTPLEGKPVELKVDGEEAAVLVGQDARSVRVTDADGTEMLLAIYGPRGELLDEGAIPRGASLVLPVECAAGGTATYHVYFDNPEAGRVPDYLSARPGLVNGSVEQGSGETPDGWRLDPADAEHRTVWSKENPHSGDRCLKTVVAPEADATWIAGRQGGIHIAGGARYRIEAWVKAEDVEGYAGWYLHLGNSRDSMLSAPMLRAGDGTFGWKKVSLEFTAPDEANRLSLGTVLRGTGTAWFDDVTLTQLEPGHVRVKVQGVQSMKLNEMGGETNPADWPERAPARRAVVDVYNFEGQPSASETVSVDLSMIRGRARGRLDLDSIRVALDGRTIPHTCLANGLLFRSKLPARSVARYRVYFSDRGEPDERVDPAEAAGWLPNLVTNGGFEKGGPLPEAWTTTGTTGPESGVRFSLDDPGRADLGSSCARMDVAEGLPESWRGWRQTVPVQPGVTYLLSAWLKCKDVEAGEARVHVHCRKADGSLATSGGMTSISEGISGTTDWTLTSGLFTMPEDASRFQIHLTTTASGTVWHDGVSLAEVTPGRLAGFECRPVPPADGLAVWPAASVVKVFPDDPVPADAGPYRVSAAGNEREALQLAVRCGRAIDDVQVRVEPPTAPVGPTGPLSLPNPEVHVVGYVPIDYPTSYYRSEAPAWHRLIPSQQPKCDGWPGLWPDPLLPTDRFDLQANATQAVWLTFDVPKEAPAGDYRGKVRLEAGGRVLAEREYTLRVWDFALPDENHVAAIYDVRYGRSGSQYWGKPLDEMYPELVRFMAERRLSADRIRPMPEMRYVDGRVEADFREFDAAAEFYFDEQRLPYSYTPRTFYLFGWAHPPKTLFGEQPYEGEYPYEDADRTRLRPEYKEAYQACLKVFWDHVKEKGWADRMVLYISDEPHDRHDHIRIQMKALCEMIHEVDPEIPIYSSTWKHVPEWDGHLDVWGIGHYGRVAVEKMAELKEAGNRIWFTTDGQMCTDTPYCAVERLLPHYCFKYGAEAYEFWGVSWLTYNPYRYGWHSYIRQSSEPGKHYWVRYPNGDGFLIYPGEPIGHDGPVSSVRLENAREGVEDYEYLYRLKGLMEKARRAGRDVQEAEEALEEAATLIEIPNAGGRYSSKILPEPGALMRARIGLAEAIERLGADE